MVIDQTDVASKVLGIKISILKFKLCLSSRDVYLCPSL